MHHTLSKYYIIYHTSEVHTISQKMGIFPPQNEYPPIFITAHTHTLCMAVCERCSG
jgi:hypothetical protein